MNRFSWLSTYSRPFAISGRNVEVIDTPHSFFETLKEGVRNARKRIVMSSLYLGTGPREAQLVDEIHTSLGEREVECTLLLDHLRGLRGNPNSYTMLQNLLDQYDGRFRLYLYHTPNLRGLLKQVFPARFNEVMGLQHMKIYLFDDSFLISGANLSQDYFVNRQDRYVKFSSCPRLADFFASIVQTVSSHSFRARGAKHHFSPIQPPLATRDDPLSSSRAARTFAESLREAVDKLIRVDSGPPPPTTTTTTTPSSVVTMASRNGNWPRSVVGVAAGSDSPVHHTSKKEEEGEVVEEEEGESESDSMEEDTLVYPLLQMGCYGIEQDEPVTENLLRQLDKDERLHLATGYFNLPTQYTNALLEARGSCRILAASPQANGFYRARGVAKHVPYMYMHFAHQFLKRVERHQRQERGRASSKFQYAEWRKEGWTFHAKGLWYYLPGDVLPALTLVGSSNYGYRSLSRDLEIQVAMVTSNPKLKAALHKEQEHLFGHGEALSLEDARTDPERQLNFPQWLATSLLKPHV